MHFLSGGTILPGAGGFGRNRRAGEAVGASHQPQGRKMLAGGPLRTSPRPANPCNPSLPAGPGASALCTTAAQAPVREGGGEGAEAGAPGPSSGPLECSAQGLPAGWGLLRPSARSCLGEGLTRRPRPGRPGGRRRGRAAAGAQPRLWRVREGRGPYSPGPAASASAAPTAASTVHPCGGGPAAAALE